jgi:hypothetical protein
MNSSYSIRRWNQYGWFRACLYTRGILSLLVAALSQGLPLAGASTELPSTPAGKVLAGYLEALNSGNKENLETFIKAHRPDRPDALDRMLDLRWNIGGLDLHSIESSQALNIQAVLHEREGNGNYHRMSVTVSDGEPAVITKISLDVIRPPAGAPVPERLTQRAAVAAWNAEIDKAASTGKFSGVWLWAKNGQVRSPRAPGARRIARQESTTRSTRSSASAR